MSNAKNINAILKTLKKGISRLEWEILVQPCSDMTISLELLRTDFLTLYAGLVKARNAIEQYGVAECTSAYISHAIKGNGAKTVGNGNTNRGDALISGGEYLATGKAFFFKNEFENFYI